MNDCRDIRDRIGPFVEGELSVADGELVVAHMEDCATCRAIERDYRALSELLSPSPIEPSNEEEPAWRRFDADLARRLAANDERRRGLYIPLPAAAIVAFALVGAVWVSLGAHHRAERLQVQQDRLTEALMRLQDTQNSLGLAQQRVAPTRVAPTRMTARTELKMGERDPFSPTANETPVSVAMDTTPAGTPADESTAQPTPTPARKKRSVPIHFVDYEYQQGVY